MDLSFQNAWDIILKSPVEGRLEKPRMNGLTMVIDKGLGLCAIEDILEINSEYIDFLKLSFGTSLIYPDKILKEKIKLVKTYGIDIYPGGTLFEVAITQDKMHEYLFKTRQLGFTSLEISDGTIFLSSKLREEAIFKAKSLGFNVLTEVGKKVQDNSLTLGEMRNQIEKDLSAGADYIIIEGRESGKDISIYDIEGNINLEKFKGILDLIQGREEVLIWESPLKNQQTFFINELGPNVNLGNIQTGDVLALEALRRGLRGDTFKTTLTNDFCENNSNKSKGSIVGA